eukprot:3433605-Amphidinium_carterae.2
MDATKENRIMTLKAKRSSELRIAAPRKMQLTSIRDAVSDALLAWEANVCNRVRLHLLKAELENHGFDCEVPKSGRSSSWARDVSHDLSHC